MVRPAPIGSPNMPSPPWNRKGPNAYKDEQTPISTSSFSMLSHSISSATNFSSTINSSSSPSSLSSSSSLVSSPRSHACSFRCFFLFLCSFAFLSHSPSVRFTILMAESLGNGAG